MLAGYLATMIIFPAPLLPRDTPVQRVIGMPAEEAAQTLEDQGFRSRVEERESDPTIPAGHVLWQDPPPGVELPAGTPIRLTVSEGPAPLLVPDVAEFEFDQAVRILAAGGFRLGAVDSVAASQPAGVVVATRPAMGSSRPPGSPVDLMVSRGPATVRTPSVVGLDRVAARELLEAAGLRVGTVQSRSSRRDRPGTVLEQRPSAGTLIPHQGAVNLLIARPEGP